MFLFKKKQKRFLGIDIGASAVKLVELEREKEKIEMKDPVPAMLNDPNMKAEDVVYQGDLRKKDL